MTKLIVRSIKVSNTKKNHGQSAKVNSSSKYTKKS